MSPFSSNTSCTNLPRRSLTSVKNRFNRSMASAAPASVATINDPSNIRKRIDSILRWGSGQHFPVAVGLDGRHDSCGLHILDHAGSPVVADLQSALHVRYGRLPGFGDDRYGLIVQ